MASMNLAERYHTLLKEIADIAISYGRDPESITLVAVSKTQPIEDIAVLQHAGCRDFGESRVQEFIPKMAHFIIPLRWHLIGNLQKNKVNKVIGNFHLIHSVDSIELARKISEESIKKEVDTHILLEVNTSGEATKHGFTSKELIEHLDVLANFPRIHLDGLMTMAPHDGSEKVITSCFSELRELRDRCREDLKGQHFFHHLSMGMSNDYKIAIREGATLLRIGTHLFKNML